MITIPITQEMMDRAGKLATQLLEMNLRPTYTQLQAQDANYTGILGELAFEELLRGSNVKYRYEPLYNGFSDDTDFVVWVGDNLPVTLDVKTAAKSFHQRLMMPSAQVEKHPSQVYVGVRIVDDNAEVWGTCTHEELKPIKSVILPIPTHGVYLNKLRPIEKVLGRCMPNESSI